MRPLLGSRMQAMQWSSVVLPEPLGPISPTTWPGIDLHVDVAQRIDARRALTEMLGEVLDADDRLFAGLGHRSILTTRALPPDPP